MTSTNDPDLGRVEEARQRFMEKRVGTGATQYRFNLGRLRVSWWAGDTYPLWGYFSHRGYWVLQLGLLEVEYFG